MELQRYMRLAIREAEASLREGNNGFGAVIVKDGAVIACAHDEEDTKADATSHAEMNAIRIASKKCGKKLTGCKLFCTHEPCPMCAFAIVWAGITEVAFGYSIQESIAQGRKRIDFPCREVFRKANANIMVHEGVLKEACSVLYRDDVRKEIKRLFNADDAALAAMNADAVQRRMKWFCDNKNDFKFLSDDLPDSGYRLLLARFGITEKEAPVVKKTESQIVFHSMNFCPTLEACRILRLDTRQLCRKLNEDATDKLVKQVDGRLTFSRNDEKLRPYADYCEEMICLSGASGGPSE